jgi:tetratricopeptide (TPR) repeat protein
VKGKMERKKLMFRMVKKHFILFIALLLSFTVFSQTAEKLVRKGNTQYKSGNYKDAEVTYKKALAKDSNNVKGKFNMADAIYKQGNYEEALKTYQSLMEDNLDKDTKASIYHNIGNSLLQSKKYDQCIEAYKNALRNNPDDQDTKYNLSYAEKMLKKQQQQQQQQQNKDNKDKDKKDQKQDQKQDQNKKDQDKDKQQQQQKDQISKEDAKRMLDALNNKDKNLQDKLKEQKVVPSKAKTDKDW